jgi:Ca2+-binding RTX toxin-like protein
MTRSARIIGVATAALLAVAPAASASSVDIAANVLRYAGGPEANHATLTFSGGEYVVTDQSHVTVVAGSGCANPENDNTATCSGSVTRLDFSTGGGRDQIDGSDPSLPAFSGVSELDGGGSDDVILGSRGADNLRGGDGDDLLLGGQGADWSFGGDSPVTVDLAPGTIGDGAAFEADDANHDGTVEGVFGSDQADHLTGTAGNDTLWGFGGDDTIDGLDGADDLDGSDGSDTVSGGNDEDSISGGEGRDALDGGSGADTVRYVEHSAPVRVTLGSSGPQGAAGEDDSITSFESVTGGSGDDTLVGDGGGNVLDGGPGDDELDGGLGNDWLLGGDGLDTVTYASRTASVTVDLNNGFIPLGGQAGEGDLVVSERIRGGSGDDTITGNRSPNILDGGPGADRLFGVNGDDRLSGDAGRDVVDGGAGEDLLRTRDGEADTVACGTEFDVATADSADALSDCESIDTGARPETGGGAPPAPRADTTKPRLTLGAVSKKQLKRKAFLKGLPLSLTCDEACSLDVELRGSARGVRLARAYDVTLAQRSLASGTGARELTLKPNRKLIGKARGLTVQLRVVATDAAGNRTTATKVLRVR